MLSEDLSIVVIETDDHAGHYLDTSLLDSSHRLPHVGAQILGLLGFAQARRPRRLDPDEHRAEICRPQELEELFVLRDIEGDLGHQLERKPSTTLPFPERTQEFLGKPPIADEVVIDDEDRRSAESIDLLDLLHHLVDRLGARFAAVHHDDVAKLTTVRTASAELDRHGPIRRTVEKIEARHRAPL